MQNGEVFVDTLQLMAVGTDLATAVQFKRQALNLRFGDRLARIRADFIGAMV
jgi:hypothetical protein